MKRKIPEFKVYKNNYGQIDVSFYEEDFQNIKQFYKLLDPILQEIKSKYTGYLMDDSAIYSVGSHLNDALDQLVFFGQLGLNNNNLWVVKPPDKWIDEADYMNPMHMYSLKNKSYKDSYECEFINPSLAPPKAKYLDLDAAPVKQNPPIQTERLLGVVNGGINVWAGSYGVRLDCTQGPYFNMKQVAELHKLLGQAIETVRPKVEVVDDDILI